MGKPRILFVEDDASGRELGLYNLRKAGYEADAAETGEQALGLFSPERYALVITDLKMPGISGMEVLATIKKQAPDQPVLVITAYGSVDVAVEAMKQGAYDFIDKPFNREHLLLSVQRALDHHALGEEVQDLRRKARGIERELVVASKAMARVLDIADRVAQSDASVLITGETGTGKELVARRVHARSDRADKPFVAINCAAVPAELLESELFGHEKGAFTGATRARPGRFRQADTGTLFLDEIGELPPPLQGKLLRVLQEHVVDVVGGDTPVQVDVRVIAATNQDLLARAREGAFREDLLYRLNVVEIRVPPLPERSEEIEPLVRHFVERLSGSRDLAIPDELITEMRARPWPGNVRQLENACERLVILCRGDTLSAEDLPPREPGRGGIRAGTGALLDSWPPLPEDGLDLVDLEKRVIRRVLELKKGNVTQAATYLGVPRHILAYRMAKYGISRE